MKNIDPALFNISSRTKLFMDDLGNINMLIERKSRIIIKDGKKIIAISKKIKSINEKNRLTVFTSAPVCSKTKGLLEKNKIYIKEV